MAQVVSEFGTIVGSPNSDIQVGTMPTYTDVPLGTIVQFIGTTDANYTNGYFYKRGASGWENINVQNGGGGEDNSINAPYETSPATTAHSIDDYITYNDVIYIVIDDISIGDTLTVNTNIEVPSIEDGTVIYSY